jgi:capsule polysaccharide export protein KpsE/RkpR
MSNDERQHQMDFILKQQAVFSADIEQLKEVQRQQAESINQLTTNIEAMRGEMQESFNHLIVANEVTRKLAEDVARLTVGLSQRVTKLEQE